MQMRVRVSSAAWLFVVICVPCLAHGQVRFEASGARALGMAGAFVAVADDPTAVLWNPAALVQGAPAALTIGLDRFHFRKPSEPALFGGGSSSSEFFGFGSWPLGISYGHFSAAGLRRTNDVHSIAESLSLHELGFSVLQTLLDGDIRGERATLTGGATFKYVYGTAGSAVIAGQLTVEDALDLARSATGDGNNTFDIDVGVLADLGRFRAGLTLKNLRSPSFPTSAGTEIQLARLARIGLSAQPIDGVTLAMDVDLDTADPLVGQRQVIALGGETRVSDRAAVRGGVRWHYRGVRQPTGAVGGSLRLRQGLWIDGYVALGRSHDQGFGIALRGGLF